MRLTMAYKMNMIVGSLVLFTCVGGDPDCERRRVFSKDTKTQDGFSYPLPHARGHIYVSQNGKSIARADFKTAPPTYNTNDDVIRMDNTCIVTKDFLDTKIELKYRNEDQVYKDECVLYEVQNGSVESEPKNVSSSVSDNNQRPPLRTGIIGTAVLLLVVIFVLLWKTLMRDHNGDGTPAHCCFIRGQLPTSCPRADGPDWV